MIKRYKREINIKGTIIKGWEIEERYRREIDVKGVIIDEKYRGNKGKI